MSPLLHAWPKAYSERHRRSSQTACSGAFCSGCRGHWQLKVLTGDGQERMPGAHRSALIHLLKLLRSVQTTTTRWYRLHRHQRRRLQMGACSMHCLPVQSQRRYSTEVPADSPILSAPGPTQYPQAPQKASTANPQGLDRPGCVLKEGVVGRVAVAAPWVVQLMVNRRFWKSSMSRDAILQIRRSEGGARYPRLVCP